jgi:hypothetical protein
LQILSGPWWDINEGVELVGNMLTRHRYMRLETGR